MDFKKTNPAVLKSMFLQMDKETFIKNALDCQKELIAQPISLQNANYRFALINLYKWLKAIYRKRYICNNKK